MTPIVLRRNHRRDGLPVWKGHHHEVLDTEAAQNCNLTSTPVLFVLFYLFNIFNISAKEGPRGIG